MEALSKISGELLWPAAAGNVIWSLLSLLITLDSNAAIHDRLPHLVALSLIALYLCGNWIRRMRYGDNEALFVCFDVMHLLGISVCALSIYAKPQWAEYYLAGIFAMTGIMHFVGAGPTTRERWVTRILFGLASFLGVVTICVWRLLSQDFGAWSLSAAIASVLITWSVLLRCFPSPQIKDATQPKTPDATTR